MNMQAYNPKEEQALPSDYEQLLNHTVHQLRHKINVCGQKNACFYYKSMHLPPKAGNYEVEENNQGLTLYTKTQERARAVLSLLPFLPHSRFSSLFHKHLPDYA